MRVTTNWHTNLYTWGIGVQYARFFGDRSISVFFLCFSVLFRWSIHNPPLGIFNTCKTLPATDAQITWKNIADLITLSKKGKVKDGSLPDTQREEHTKP